jgi:hypothetical protein
VRWLDEHAVEAVSARGPDDAIAVEGAAEAASISINSQLGSSADRRWAVLLAASGHFRDRLWALSNGRPQRDSAHRS